ncbi:MAG: 30S ribosomal protein S20 [Verrucomicrobia bacterium]|nr:30S ribosomal protein S20 [Verrucomicrobiota bacterium]MBU6445893.1 30S ribosomal protein S20 [Verrucomicrobiota bacterium]MDE3046728.1 30S ribosomal protein S20 [Verrucomicrobiota bacterium]
MAEEKKAEAPKKEAKKEGVKRKPSALKRDQQSEKRRLRNRSYRATVLTSVRALENSLNQKESPEAIKSKLNLIYSLVDKGVKKGVYKPEKAARTKSRLSARCAK